MTQKIKLTNQGHNFMRGGLVSNKDTDMIAKETSSIDIISPI
jgi:hypothetical protein